MPTYSIKNQTPSTLDMSPLRDIAGAIITLKPQGKPGDSAEVDDETLGNPIMQRVLSMKWLSVSEGAQGVSSATAAPAAPAASVPAEQVKEVIAAAPKAEEVVPPAPVAEEPAKVEESAAPVAEEPAKVEAPAAPAEEPAKVEEPAAPAAPEPPIASIPVETSTSSETPMRGGKTLPPKNKR